MQVSYAVQLRFVPAEILPFPTYNGILVERSVHLVNSTSGDIGSPPLVKIPLAEVVLVRIGLSSADELGPVEVR